MDTILLLLAEPDALCLFFLSDCCGQDLQQHRTWNRQCAWVEVGTHHHSPVWCQLWACDGVLAGCAQAPSGFFYLEGVLDFVTHLFGIIWESHVFSLPLCSLCCLTWIVPPFRVLVPAHVLLENDAFNMWFAGFGSLTNVLLRTWASVLIRITFIVAFCSVLACLWYQVVLAS